MSSPIRTKKTVLSYLHPDSVNYVITSLLLNVYLKASLLYLGEAMGNRSSFLVNCVRIQNGIKAS